MGADPTWKASWRFIGRWVCQNHKMYYTYVVGCAFLVYEFWWYSMVGYYRARNHHRSLEWAIQAEKEWEKNKPAEEDEYGDEEYGDEAGGDAAAEGGDAGGDGEEEEE